MTLNLQSYQEQKGVFIIILYRVREDLGRLQYSQIPARYPTKKTPSPCSSERITDKGK